MAHTLIDVHVPVTPEVPRGARIAADLFASAQRALHHLFEPRHLSHAEEAAPVRALAQSMLNTDPSFAADLFAAAARHEALDDEPVRH